MRQPTEQEIERAKQQYRQPTDAEVEAAKKKYRSPRSGTGPRRGSRNRRSIVDAIPQPKGRVDVEGLARAYEANRQAFEKASALGHRSAGAAGVRHAGHARARRCDS